MMLGLRRRAFLSGCCGLAAAPLLVACGLFSKPVPQQPAPSPTPSPPTPTVTPTRAAVRIDTPVPPPTVTAVSGTLRATPTTNPALRGNGQLLYAGVLGGVGGIILADLATDKRQLLTVGNYKYLAWAPDGSRFAAIGVGGAELSIQQVAIFAADGRPLARIPIPLARQIDPQLLWSPNSRALLYRVGDPTTGTPTAWIIDEEGQRPLLLDPDAMLWRWTPGGRLAYITLSARNASPSAQSPATLWTIAAAGDDPRQVASGAFYPIALSPDGATLYTVGGFRALTAGNTRIGSVTMLLALDPARGMSRTLLDFNAVAAGETAWLAYADAAPVTGLLAVLRGSIAVAAQQNTIGVTNEVIVLDTAGQEVAHDLPWEGDSGISPFYWSPHGVRVAYHVQTVGGGGSELRALDINGGTRSVYRVRAADPRDGVLAAWSTDDRWLAYVDGPPTGLLIAEFGQARVYPFAADGNFPAWRPQQ